MRALPFPLTLGGSGRGVDLVREVDQYPRQPRSVLGLDHRGTPEPLGVRPAEVRESRLDHRGPCASLSAQRLGHPARHPRHGFRISRVERDVPHDHSPESVPFRPTGTLPNDDGARHIVGGPVDNTAVPTGAVSLRARRPDR